MGKIRTLLLFARRQRRRRARKILFWAGADNRRQTFWAVANDPFSCALLLVRPILSASLNNFLILLYSPLSKKEKWTSIFWGERSFPCCCVKPFPSPFLVVAAFAPRRINFWGFRGTFLFALWAAVVALAAGRVLECWPTELEVSKARPKISPYWKRKG